MELYTTCLSYSQLGIKIWTSNCGSSAKGQRGVGQRGASEITGIGTTWESASANPSKFSSLVPAADVPQPGPVHPAASGPSLPNPTSSLLPGRHLLWGHIHQSGLGPESVPGHLYLTGNHCPLHNHRWVPSNDSAQAQLGVRHLWRRGFSSQGRDRSSCLFVKCRPTFREG